MRLRLQVMFSVRLQLFSKNYTLNVYRQLCCKMMQEELKTVFLHSVATLSPTSLMRNVLRIDNSTLTVKTEKYELKKNVYLIGFGKAVLGMAYPAVDLLQDHIQGGILSIPVGARKQFPTEIEMLEEKKIEIYEGAKNNLPDQQSLEAAIKISDLVQKLNESCLLLVLISGGGSALLPLPKHPVLLAEKSHLIKSLASAGASITQLNTVRKKISELKGGGLASIASPARVVSLILSDVIGDPLDVIASGPTIQNNDAPCAALDIIKMFNLESEISPSVQSVLQENSQSLHKLTNVQNIIIGNNKMALEAAGEKARDLGYYPVILTDSIQGDIVDVCLFYTFLIRLFTQAVKKCITSSEFMVNLHNQMPISKLCNNLWLNEKDIQACIEAMKVKKGVCFILGGETTVIVRGKGKGGRNQELALRLAVEVHRLKSELIGLNILALMVGTDGIDGPTEAAGAFASSNIIDEALSTGLSAEDFLLSNDAFNFYKKLKNGKYMVLTGHTGTNVMDEHMIVFQSNIPMKND